MNEQSPAADAASKKESRPVAQNPNPRANENISEKVENQQANETKEVGTEITDGEDG